MVTSTENGLSVPGIELTTPEKKYLYLMTLPQMNQASLIAL